MERYSVISHKNPREIVLLKARPCFWGKCAFCDYTFDNEAEEETCYKVNCEVLEKVKGLYGFLEVINSGSAPEIDKKTLARIGEICRSHAISKLSFESHYAYKDRLQAFKEEYFASFSVMFKCGIETFDERLRNEVLKKGVFFKSVEEVKKHFDSVCLLECFKGQTKETIENDIKILTDHFEYGCVNIFCNNSTPVQRDEALVKWFFDKYGYLDEYPHIDVLYRNTDFGVGE